MMKENRIVMMARMSRVVQVYKSINTEFLVSTRLGQRFFNLDLQFYESYSVSVTFS